MTAPYAPYRVPLTAVGPPPEPGQYWEMAAFVGAFVSLRGVRPGSESCADFARWRHPGLCSGTTVQRYLEIWQNTGFRPLTPGVEYNLGILGPVPGRRSTRATVETPTQDDLVLVGLLDLIGPHLAVRAAVSPDSPLSIRCQEMVGEVTTLATLLMDKREFAIAE